MALLLGFGSLGSTSFGAFGSTALRAFGSLGLRHQLRRCIAGHVQGQPRGSEAPAGSGVHTVGRLRGQGLQGYRALAGQGQVAS